MVTVTINGEERQYQVGTTYEQIAADYKEQYDDTIALVIVDGKIQELMKKVVRDCEIQFLTLKNDAGHKAYVRTAIMLMIKALYDVEARENIEKIKVEFAIGQGYYCSLKGNIKVDRTLVERLKVRMHQLVMENMPIEKKNYPMAEAIALFDRYGMEDKKKLFRYRRSSTINVYRLDDYYDYYYGYMLPSTGYVKYFFRGVLS